MVETVTIHAAKTNLSRLVARAEAGEEIVIARGGTPVAKLVPLNPPAKPERRPGRMKGLGHLTLEQALEPLPDEWLGEWFDTPPDEPGKEPKR
jgi:prevent-host-death family protein